MRSLPLFTQFDEVVVVTDAVAVFLPRPESAAVVLLRVFCVLLRVKVHLQERDEGEG